MAPWMLIIKRFNQNIKEKEHLKTWWACWSWWSCCCAYKGFFSIIIDFNCRMWGNYLPGGPGGPGGPAAPIKIFRNDENLIMELNLRIKHKDYLQEELVMFLVDLYFIEIRHLYYGSKILCLFLFTCWSRRSYCYWS